MAIDSKLFLDGANQLALDVPTQRLSIGAQLPSIAVGVQAGFIEGAIRITGVF